MVDRIGLEIRGAHYPAYCSKHNPIEHRVFCRVTLKCEGVVFDSVATVKHFMERTKTQAGLSAKVDIMDKVYEAGRKACEHLKSVTRIVWDAALPKWNYVLSSVLNE